MMDYDWDGLVRARIESGIAVTTRLLESDCLQSVDRVVKVVVTCLSAGGKVFFFGNGGSATQAQHLSAELLGRFYRDRPSLPSISLSDNSAAMTAIANDYAYAETFSRQLLGLASPGDVAIGLSTSGSSENVVRALEVARKEGLVTVGFTGAAGGRMAEVADEVIRIPSSDTPRVQEAHLLLGHIICEAAEQALFPQA